MRISHVSLWCTDSAGTFFLFSPLQHCFPCLTLVLPLIHLSFPLWLSSILLLSLSHPILHPFANITFQIQHYPSLHLQFLPSRTTSRSTVSITFAPPPIWRNFSSFSRIPTIPKKIPHPTPPAADSSGFHLRNLTRIQGYVRSQTSGLFHLGAWSLWKGFEVILGDNLYWQGLLE